MIGKLITCIRLETNKIIISRYNFNIIKFSFHIYIYIYIITDQNLSIFSKIIDNPKIIQFNSLENNKYIQKEKHNDKNRCTIIAKKKKYMYQC